MAENFGVGNVATVSNLNPSYIELLWVELSQVQLGLGFDNKHDMIQRILLSVVQTFNF